jgi:8-oxo-dGTP pyrophosphatase MutT (NUDIX family)
MSTPETHQNFNIGVKALIIKDGKVLLLKRADHNVWEPPGGRINVGETLEITLMRELAEELPGIKKCVIMGNIHADSPDFNLSNGNRLMLLFMRVSAMLPKSLSFTNEHSQLAWVSATQLEGMDMQPAVRVAARAALISN